MRKRHASQYANFGSLPKGFYKSYCAFFMIWIIFLLAFRYACLNSLGAVLSFFGTNICSFLIFLIRRLASKNECRGIGTKFTNSPSVAHIGKSDCMIISSLQTIYQLTLQISLVSIVSVTSRTSIKIMVCLGLY